VGIQYLENVGPADLDGSAVIDGDRVTHLIYRVRAGS
jgi:hypothetical protein